MTSSAVSFAVNDFVFSPQRGAHRAAFTLLAVLLLGGSALPASGISTLVAAALLLLARRAS